MQYEFDVNKIVANGWRQGSCLSIGEMMKIFPVSQCQCVERKLPEGLYIVLSQDCDILNPSLGKEPVVEIIKATQIQQIDKKKNAGENPREIHLEIVDSAAAYLKIVPNDRFFVPRTYLETQQPNQVKIADKTLRHFIRWMIKRYRRPGFPGEFNKRIEPKKKEIKKIMERIEAIAKTEGLFIQLGTENELPARESYEVLVKLLVPKAVYDNEKRVEQIKIEFKELIVLLDQIEGIEVREDSRVQSTGNITVHDYQQLKQYDLDYLSFLNGKEADLVGDYD